MASPAVSEPLTAGWGGVGSQGDGLPMKTARCVSIDSVWNPIGDISCVLTSPPLLLRAPSNL